MSKYIKPIIFLLVIIIAMFFYSFFDNHTKDNDKKIINIKNLSTEFVDKYFEEVKSLTDEDLEHSLIVTSLKDFDKTGAIKVIEGPNHQFLLTYDSKEKLDEAKKILDENKDIIRTTENFYLDLYDTNHMSWGVEKTGMNVAIDMIENGDYGNVKVAVIDTGCDLETFNTYHNGRIKETHNLYDEKDIYDNDGHGTHVAGIVADATPSNVDIIPFKIGEEKPNFFLLLAAYNYIIINDSVDVINLSLGSYSSLEDLYIDIKLANEMGIITVAASGNHEEEDEEMLAYPAAYDNTISVSAVDSNLKVASWSNYNDAVTFSAPGARIRSVNGIKSGTSMATPHVTSAVALLKLIDKDISYENTINILKKYAIDLGEEGRDEYYGYGFIDLSQFASIINDIGNLGFDSVETPESITIDYNYGNETNLMNLNLTFIDGNGNEHNEKLSDISDKVTISGYDAFSCDTQNVTIKYENLEKQIAVKNNVCEINAYQTENVGTNGAIITGILDEEVKEYINIVPNIDGKEVQEIGEELFLNSSVKKVILPSTLKTIRDSAFADSSVESITGDANEVSIKSSAFNGAKNLKIFTPSIKNLEESAFYSAKSLTSVTFSDKLKVIPDYAFYDTSMISDIDLTNITEIGELAFTNTRVKELYIPKTLTTIDEAGLLLFPYLEKIVVEEGNPYYDSRENSNNLIDTAKNKIMLGSSNSFVPDSVKAIGDYAFFSNYKIMEIDTNKVTDIGDIPFGACPRLEKVIFNKSLKNVGITPLDGSIRAVVYAYTSDFLDEVNSQENTRPYGYINMSPNVIVSGSKDEYTAFDDVSDISVEATYDGYINSDDTTLLREDITNYEIIYENGSDSFRYGDTHYTIKFTNKFGIEVTKEIPVTVNKKTIDYIYTSSNNIVKKDGKPHGINLSVESPNEAKILYMDNNGKYTLTNMPTYINPGTYVINYKIYIDDNYNEIYGSETLIINDNNVNYSTDYSGLYDGNNHTFNLDIRLDNYNVVYSLDNINYNISTKPSFSDVGEHVVYYKVTYSGGEILGSNKVKIYGVKNISNKVTIKDSNIIIKNNSFNNLINQFTVYSDKKQFKHFDNKNALINNDMVKTGEKMIISISGKDAYTYGLSYLGDMTGDGKINSADLLRMRQHLIGIKTSSGSYYLAGDITEDGKINSGDLLRLRQHLIGTRLIS